MNISLLEDEDNIPVYKIIIVGRTKSGKTKLLTRYKFGNYTDEGVITMGVDCLTIKSSQAKFNYYDTAGQDRYRAIVSSYYKGSDACILVYDANSTQSFQDMSYYYNTIKQSIPDCLLYIVGCKSDLELHVSQEMIHKHYRSYKHYLTSAKKNQNVQQMFKSLQQQLVKTRQKKNLGEKVTKSVLVPHERAKKKKCCQ